MNLSIIIVLGILLLLVAIAVIMLHKERKRDENHCIGCPHKDRCSNDGCHKVDDN